MRVRIGGFLAERALIAVAVLKVGIGIGVVVVASLGAVPVTTPRDYLMLAIVASFGLAALLLLVWGRGDARAHLLGVTFLLVAAVFADTLLAPWQRHPSQPLPLVAACFALQVDALTPYFLWQFVRAFPRPSAFGARQRIPNIASAASLVVGVALLLLNLGYYLTRFVPAPAPLAALLWLVARHNPHGLYSPIQFGLTLAAFPTLIWKAGGIAPAERRRVAMLVAAVTAGTAPTVIWVLLTALSDTAARVLPLRTAGWAIYPALLAAPVATAYAVLVHHALDVRLVIRRALRYALARYTVIAAAAVPFLLLVRAVYARRDASVVELVSGANALFLLLLLSLALCTLPVRRRMLDYIDKLFFREHYDAKRILRDLVQAIGNCSTSLELATTIRSEIDQALHLQAVHFLVRDAGTGDFVDPHGGVRPLGGSSVLAARAGRADRLSEIDLSREVAVSMPESDRYWLVDANARLVIPLTDRRHGLTGLLVLGEKRNEQAFTSEDRLLLGAVASAAALALASMGAATVPEAAPLAPAIRQAQEAAAECPECHALYASTQRSCERCACATTRAPLPLTISGKFRLTDRIGAGGMGVVYRGIDLSLARTVAIKTLPRMSPDRAARLRREARAMASVTHPNLAAIYAVESWRGVPVLVCEYLDGGTLADRLAGGPLPLLEALDVAVVLTRAAGALHRAGMLHRDIKPSNVGFHSDGILKLLDFGLARMLTEGLIAPASQQLAGGMAAAPDLEQVPPAGPGDTRLVGTPIYLSPEAVSGQAPQPAFDLWSICMVLYESIAGVNPMAEDDVHHTYRRIAACDVPVDSCPVIAAEPQLAEFFQRAFAPDPSQRPRTAPTLLQQLSPLRGAFLTRTLAA